MAATNNQDAGRRVCVITGGSSGLGFNAAERLLREDATGPWHIVLGCRDPGRAESAAARLREAAAKGGPNAKASVVEWLPLDLLKLASVRTFAERFLATGLPLHVLLLNAGAMIGARTMTDDNVEATFQGNHLGHFLLTHLLLDRLRASKPARIVIVASDLHGGMKKTGGPNVDPQPIFEWDNIQGEKSYDGMRFYAKSKLINLWFGYALAAQIDPAEVTVNAFCPGFVPTTGLKRDGNWFLRGIMDYVLPWLPFTTSEERSAGHYLRLITDPALAGKTGLYLSKGQVVKSSAESYDREQMVRMWNLSVELAKEGHALTEVKDIWSSP